MASAFDALLDPTGDAADTPEKAAALAAALKRQSRYGAIGQLMGVQPTQQVGAGLQEQAQGSLKMALAQRQQQRALEAEKARQAVEDARWERNFEQDERGIEATRTNQAATRAGSGPIIDTAGGKARVTPENTTVPILDPSGGQVQPLPKTPNESQNTLATYASRIEQNLPVITGLIDKGYVPSPKDYMLVSSGANPMIVQAGLSDQGKMYYGTASQIINAIMRRESGAAISAGEWANANARWLPQPGDPPELIAQKRANLSRELEVLKEASGPAYVQPTQQQPAAPPPAKPAAAPRRKVVGGKAYVQTPTGWAEE
jgi:hypothetical protein